METSFWMSVSAGLVACVVTTAGIMAVRRHGSWARQNTTYFACFAAGVLIAVSFLHMIPRSLAMNGHAPAFLFSGYLAMHIYNRFLTAFVCDKPQTADYALGLVPLLGIGLHSFLDGMIYSISFNVNVFTGTLVTFGMVLHEFPEGIVTYALMLRSGFAERHAFFWAFAAAALTTPLGAVVSYPFVSSINQSALGALLSLSAGALIYVGATHLLPRAEIEPRRYSLVALASGVLVALGIVLGKG